MYFAVPSGIPISMEAAVVALAVAEVARVRAETTRGMGAVAATVVMKTDPVVMTTGSVIVPIERGVKEVMVLTGVTVMIRSIDEAFYSSICLHAYLL